MSKKQSNPGPPEGIVMSHIPRSGKLYESLYNLYQMFVDVAKTGEDKTVVWAFPAAPVEIKITRGKYPKGGHGNG